jgi:hypothetical protein
MKMNKIGWIAALAVLGMTTVTQGAVIDWSSVDLTLGGTEVSTTGTLLEALNFDTAADDATINGVTFSGFSDFANPSATYFSANSDSAGVDSHNLYTAGLATYTGLLSNTIYDKHATEGKVTLSGLVADQQYQIQLFMADVRDSEVATTFTMDIGTLDAWTSPRLDTNNRDGYVINGVFTADAATQLFEMNKNGSKGLQMGAYQLRAIPEPATLGLVASFSGAILFIRRRLMM